MYRIQGTILKWFWSYLEDRKQKVKYKHTLNKRQVECKVLQGSLLGSLLFIIFINDIDTAF